MKKYQVLLDIQVSGEVIIEANSLEDAEAKALDLAEDYGAGVINHGNFDFLNEVVEVESVTELNP